MKAALKQYVSGKSFSRIFPCVSQFVILNIGDDACLCVCDWTNVREADSQNTYMILLFEHM